MKQGSADDPFAEDATESEPSVEQSPESEQKAQDSEVITQATGSVSPAQRQSLPFIHARDGVKDGRTQRPVFLRDHIEDGIDELLAHVEAELGEDVYKTDVTEAAMAIAQENPELVLAKLEEWGYGWS